MSQSRQEEGQTLESEEKNQQETEEEEKGQEANAEEPMSSALACPLQDSNTEQAPKQDSWLWNWLPFPLLSGLTWLGDRNKPAQDPVCCQLERKGSSSTMCPDCEITFCKKCEKLHYSQAFIEHGLLGHSAEDPPELLSPATSTGSLDLAAAPEETEEEEMKRQ